MSLRKSQAKKKQKLSGVGEHETGTANPAVGALFLEILRWDVEIIHQLMKIIETPWFDDYFVDLIDIIDILKIL